MGLLSDRQIKALCQTDKPMIEPFVEKQMREGVISYGLSSYGYDLRVADEFKIFTPNPYNTVVDPKHIDERSLIPFQGEVCIIPPNSFTLARSVERVMLSPRRRSHSTSRDGGVSPGHTCRRSVIGGVMS